MDKHFEKIKDNQEQLQLPIDWFCREDSYENSTANIILRRINILANMIYELAEMIEERTIKLDNAIEQANEQSKTRQGTVAEI